MAFIDTIAPQQAEGEVRALYLRQQSQQGQVPNFVRVFCHRPEIMALWGALLAGIKANMDHRRFELVTFHAAHELRNSPCALAHGKALARYFGDRAVIDMAAGRGSDWLTPAEAAMADFARQVARDAAAIRREDVENLKAQGLDDGEIFDIAAAVAARAFFTKVLDALGVLPDAASAELDPEFVAALTVGRPLEERPC